MEHLMVLSFFKKSVRLRCLGARSDNFKLWKMVEQLTIVKFLEPLAQIQEDKCILQDVVEEADQEEAEDGWLLLEEMV
jgi:hypothetical protein